MAPKYHTSSIAMCDGGYMTNNTAKTAMSCDGGYMTNNADGGDVSFVDVTH
jgi:hypothetical protein